MCHNQRWPSALQSDIPSEQRDINSCLWYFDTLLLSARLSGTKLKARPLDERGFIYFYSFVGYLPPHPLPTQDVLLTGVHTPPLLIYSFTLLPRQIKEFSQMYPWCVSLLCHGWESWAVTHFTLTLIGPKRTWKCFIDKNVILEWNCLLCQVSGATFYLSGGVECTKRIKRKEEMCDHFFGCVIPTVQ